MHMRSFFCCALILALGPATALAEAPRQYFGLQLGGYEYEVDDNGPADGEVARIKYGLELSKFLAAEVHFGLDSVRAKHQIREGAVFGRFQLPYEGVNVYFLAGIGRVGGDFGDGRETQTGPAGGVGIELFGTENSAVALEYLHYKLEDDDEDRDYKAVTLGWKHHFEWPSFR